jgi:leucyl aminopeptidase
LIRVSESAEGLKVLVSPMAAADPERDPRLRSAPAARLRDGVGQALIALERAEVSFARFDFDVPEASLPAALLGLELSLYRYKRVLADQPAKIALALAHRGTALTKPGTGVELGRAVNLARHLVNLPPNLLNPVTYAEFIGEVFAAFKTVRIDTWDETRLARERCGLHLAVGAGSSSAPRLVKLSYRPAKSAKGVAPIALVGKGITFDSGGLDIKPAAGMRLMKKDMGGSAAVLGALYWAALTGANTPIDAYVALAENSISSRAFRPGDVLTARNGTSVEIHNTDAEGRLVLADALDVAVTAEVKPELVIDVATLTGAIKVALGAQLAGLFGTDEKLSAGLARAGTASGDLTWAMPLVQRYRTQSNSNFADVVNAVDGFGGAITAALFLEKFARDVPWAHLDIYAWKDAPEGAWAEGGGSGQGVLLLAEWLGAR